MAIQKVLVPPVANASLESELRARLRHVGDPSGPLDPVEQLAVQGLHRLGGLRAKRGQDLGVVREVLGKMLKVGMH